MVVDPLHWGTTACGFETGSFRMARQAEADAHAEGVGTGTAAHLVGEVALAGDISAAMAVTNTARWSGKMALSLLRA